MLFHGRLNQRHNRIPWRIPLIFRRQSRLNVVRLLQLNYDLRPHRLSFGFACRMEPRIHDLLDHRPIIFERIECLLQAVEYRIVLTR